MSQLRGRGPISEGLPTVSSGQANVEAVEVMLVAAEVKPGTCMLVSGDLERFLFSLTSNGPMLSRSMDFA